jgi:hypothetical protein
VSKGFIQIRRGLLEHVENGTIGLLDLGVYVQIHLQVNYETGVWMGSAAKLAATAPRDADDRAIRRSLENLERIGFIKRFMVRGKRGNYPVVVNKYEPQCGAMMGKRLNAEKTVDWRQPVYESCHEVSVRCPGSVREDASILKEEVKEEEKDNTNTIALSVNPSRSSLEVETQENAFEVFWEQWPRKQQKSAALKAWLKVPISEYPSIMAGLAKWRRSDQWGRGVIPHPATWLNQKRWQDEDVPQVSGGSNAREQGRKPTRGEKFKATLAAAYGEGSAN